jgi:hypothetical protein
LGCVETGGAGATGSGVGVGRVGVSSFPQDGSETAATSTR